MQRPAWGRLRLQQQQLAQGLRRRLLPLLLQVGAVDIKAYITRPDGQLFVDMALAGGPGAGSLPGRCCQIRRPAAAGQLVSGQRRRCCRGAKRPPLPPAGRQQTKVRRRTYPFGEHVAPGLTAFEEVKK